MVADRTMRAIFPWGSSPKLDGQNPVAKGPVYGLLLYAIGQFLTSVCGCGGIGRHARLRGVWLMPCEFDSRHPHFS